MSSGDYCVFMPMRLSVLLVGLDGLPCAGPRHDYSLLAGGQPEYVENSPIFSPEDTDEAYVLKKGAHLHWELPAPLRTGKRQGGETIYPQVPERWLVSRLCPSFDRHWLVESDHLDLLQPGGSRRRGETSSPRRSLYRPGDRKNFYRYQGRSYGFNPGEPVPTAGERLEKLTAVMPGDIAFSAYYPGCRNIFGFHDALDNIPAGRKVNLSYLVCGWYADPEKDFLVGKSLTELREKYGLLLSSLPAKASLRCHGLASGLNFSPEAVQFPGNLPSLHPRLAMGHNSAQAMDALNRYGSAAPMQMLLGGGPEASGDDSGGKNRREAEYLAHENCFVSTRLAHLYSVQKRPGWQEAPDTPAFEQKAGLALSGLNEAKTALNRAEADAKELRAQIFLLWRRLEQSAKDKPGMAQRQDLQASISRREDALKGQLAQADRLAGQIRRAGLALARSLKLRGYILKAVPDECFYAPADPAMLFSGEAAADPEAPETLLCRLASELLRPAKPGPAAGQRQSIPPQRTTPEWGLLLDEALLLAEGESEARRLLEAGKASGVAPADIALSRGTAPWRAIHLNWRLSYLHDGQLDQGLVGWRPNASGLDLEPDPQAAPAKNAAQPLIVSGSSPLTPHVPKIMDQALQKLADAASTEDSASRYRALAGRASRLEVKSQRLSGLHDRLLSRRAGLIFPVDDFKPEPESICREISTLVGAERHHYPERSGVMRPLRGGALQLDRLALVDAFGRLMPVLASAEVAVPPGLETPKHAGMLLAPRLTEPCRLRLRQFNQGSHSGQSSQDRRSFEVADSPFDSASPAFAWLAVDRAEQALMVYDADGEFLGKLRAEGAEKPIEMEQVPGQPDGLWRERGELSAFVGAICGRPGRDLHNLLLCVDRSAGMINPCGNAAVKNLARFVGKPVALVRVGLALEMMKLPAEPNFGESKKLESYKGLEGLRLPVRLGDPGHINEGLIGFFQSYDVFNNCVRADEFANFPKDGLVRNNNRLDLEISYVKPKESILTLLLDPTSPLHLLSGFLPVKTVRSGPVRGIVGKLKVSYTARDILTPQGEPELPLWQSAGLMVRWHERDEAGGWAAPLKPHNPARPAVFPERPAELRDGHLLTELDREQHWDESREQDKNG